MGFQKGDLPEHICEEVIRKSEYANSTASTLKVNRKIKFDTIQNNGFAIHLLNVVLIIVPQIVANAVHQPIYVYEFQ